ncbi:TetR/AcrR family transcriptional regulator [Rhodococcoides corynebacterioides]|uniref:TetR/AcrR family transcriptional regulator n=1 Tax=Rhodococcoides corynebacterioides TaxID=53972 RepID=UPI001C9A7AE7|nr:TetR/AcrR family transcriptional regulator [Rhodococcus corynebacterioides]MBY6364607.1 helix-turn-helix transcriptional regulator [Rhodococcus corynebacterioides]
MELDADSDGRRARGAASRAAILEAATSLFCGHGYSATGMSAIATAAGVHSGSIYHAFGSKQRLLDAVMDSVADRTFAAVDRVVVETTSTLSGRLTDTARVLVSDPDFLRLFLLLALERSDDADVRMTVERVRTRARSVVVAALEPTLAGLDPAIRDVAADLVGRLALILLDGVFVSQQLDSELADLDATLALVTGVADLALSQLTAIVPATQPPP